MNHPQFMIDREQIEDIRARMAGDAALRERVAALTSRREACMSEEFLTEEYANRVYSQHGNYYEIGAQLHRLVSTLSACYVLYDDGEAAARLRDAMLHVASFAVWTGPQNKDRDVPWLSDLSTTRIAVELAFGYDMIYDTLTEDERNTIARAILDKGVVPLLYDWVLPERRIHALDSMGHNWWSVCIGLAGAALLPVSDYLEKDQFDAWIAAIEQALIEFLNYPGCTLFNKVPNYDEQGLFYESVGYFCYGTGELLRYVWHAERYLGRREALRAALPAGLAEAILSFAYPYTRDDKTHIGFLNYGDSAYTANIMPMVRWLRLLGYDTPALAAYAFSVACEQDILSLTEPVNTASPVGWETLPKTAVYPQTGYAITRSDWRPDATLLAIKSGIAIIYNSLNANRTSLANARNNHLFASRSNPVGSGTHSASGMRDNAAFLCSTVLVDKFRKVRNTAKNTARRVDRKNNALDIIVCNDFIEGIGNGIVSIHSKNCLPNIRAVSQSAVNVQNGNTVANINIILVVRLVRIFPNSVAKIGRTDVLDFRRHYRPLFRKDFQ